MLYSKTAAAHLTTHVPVFYFQTTVGEAKKKIFNSVRKYQTINYVYLVDEEGILKGAVSFKKLLQKYDKTKLSTLSAKHVTYSHKEASIAYVARLAVSHNIKAVPIVDDEKKLIGVVPNDTILSELFTENRHRLYRSAGIVAPDNFTEDILSENIAESFLHRIPWIIIGLLGGLLIAGVVERFESTLQQNLVLAAFIPLIVYISDAVGTQTEAIFIRDLIVRRRLYMIKYALKQLGVAALIALGCASVIWLIVFLMWNSTFLGLVIGTAVFFTVGSSTVIALLVPYLFHLFKQDPANGSGPLATILQDFFSVIIYFTVASLFI